MNLSHPWVLNFLWLLPLMAFAFILYSRERRKALERFAEPQLLTRLTQHVNRGNLFIKALLCVAAFGLMILSLAGPRWGSHYQEVHQKGVDILILLDVSASMGVEDVKPSRLQRAKREIRDLLKNVRGDRVGLVVFSGAAFTQCPLTLDYGAVRMFLNAVTPGSVPVPGTDLGAAIQAGMSAFDPDAETDKVMLLITDGEDNEAQGIRAAEAAAQKGIKIFVFGMGDPAGGPIPLPGDKGGFKKDEAGNLVLSKLNEQGLRDIAAMTGGGYVRSVAGDLDLDVLYFDGIKSKTTAQTLKSGKIKVYEERFSLFLIAALILLLFEAMLGRIRGPGIFRKRRAASRNAAIHAGLGVVIMGSSLCVTMLWQYPHALGASDPDALYETGRFEAAEKLYAKKDMDNPKDIRYRYNRGCASYQQEAYKGAMAAFASVLKRTKDKEIRFKAAFNAGNAAFKSGDFRSAKHYYTQALRLHPEEVKAKHNLELALRKLAQQKQAQKEDKQSENRQGKDKQDSNKKKGKKGSAKEKGASTQRPSKEQNGAKNQQKKPSDTQDQGKKNAKSQKPKSRQASQGTQQKSHPPKDLSGALKPAEALPEPAKNGDEGSQAGSMARKKAEALLDNINENQAKFFKFRIPPSKQNGAASGKDW